MFGFTCVPSRKPNKFRLSRVLSEQCLDLLAACVPSCLVYMFIHVTNRTLCWSGNRFDDSLLLVPLLYIALLYIIILSHFSNMYVFSFKRCLVLYVLHYIYVLHSYICMYVHKFWRVAAFDCLRANPNFARFAGAIRHFV